MAITLTRKVAEIIDPVAFSMTPWHYGLTTHKELMERTLVGATQTIAMDKARKIVAVVREEITRHR